MTRTGSAALAALAVLGLAAGEARAQNATGRRQLNFGTVFPGVAEVIRRTDAVNSGQFQVRGTRNAEVRITMALPAALTAPGGRTLALQFGPQDGGYFTQNRIGSARAFDPRVALITRLAANNGRLFIWLGGTALPTPTQRSGNYTGTITLTVQYTGN